MTPVLDYIESVPQIERPLLNRRRPKALHNEARRLQSGDSILNNWGRMVCHDTQVSFANIGSTCKQIAKTCKVDLMHTNLALRNGAVEVLYASNIKVVLELSEDILEYPALRILLPRPSAGWVERRPVNPVALTNAESITRNIEMEASSKNLSRALDCLYSHIDPFVESRNFSLLNDLFKCLNPDRIDLTLAIGYLTSTLPLHRKIKERKLFKKRLIARLKRDGRDPKRLLAGL